MPTLEWIGKSAVVEHHNDVPFHLLRCDETLSVGEPGSGNLLIQADNLLALKALLPYYAGQVKCIYIDPPYNTGNESWVYNDNVNSPEVRAWLGQVVGKEAEDLSRHDKWLCMMYPRLVLLHELLAEDGSLWMSIDDNEMHHARLILDAIFGAANSVATCIWEKAYAPKSSARHLSDRHEYVLCYAKTKEIWVRNLLPRTEDQDKLYKNPDSDPRGLWRPNNLAARNYYSKGTYSIVTPSGRTIAGPPKGSYWRISEERLWELHAEGRIWWGPDGNNIPAPKIYMSEVKQGLVPETIWFFKDVGHSQEGKKEIVRILPNAQDVFSTPKPVRLIQRVLQIASSPGDIVLDSFAGSGTTGHAVLQLNQEDGGDRRFILIEVDPAITQDITAQRLQRAIDGYQWTGQGGKINSVHGLGGGFRYCRLGATLFDASGQIRAEVTFTDLARHIYFTETGEPLPATDSHGPLLGVHRGIAIYLLFNGVMGDRRPEGGNILTAEVLASLPAHDGPKVIYGEGCLLSRASLQALGVTFRQAPYEVKVS